MGLPRHCPLASMQRPGFDDKFVAPELFQGGGQVGGRNSREKAEPADVDAENGSVRAVEFRGPRAASCRPRRRPGASPLAQPARQGWQRRRTSIRPCARFARRRPGRARSVKSVARPPERRRGWRVSRNWRSSQCGPDFSAFFSSRTRNSLLPAGPRRGDGVSPVQRRPALLGGECFQFVQDARVNGRVEDDALAAAGFGFAGLELGLHQGEDFTGTSQQCNGRRKDFLQGDERTIRHNQAGAGKGRPGNAARLRKRALVFSITTTRGSRRSFQANCPRPTSTA